MKGRPDAPTGGVLTDEFAGLLAAPTDMLKTLFESLLEEESQSSEVN
jgi:hypothetical protein